MKKSVLRVYKCPTCSYSFEREEGPHILYPAQVPCCRTCNKVLVCVEKPQPELTALPITDEDCLQWCYRNAAVVRFHESGGADIVVRGVRRVGGGDLKEGIRIIEELRAIQ